jgi:hypothetical protein
MKTMTKMKGMKEMKTMKTMKIVTNKLLFSFLLLVSLFSFSTVLHSQSNNTNSPYTRSGYGILADQSFAAQRGMGGIGYGLSNSQLINPLNPASFSAVDSMTFMLDFGLKGQVAWFKDDLNKATKYNAGLEYLAMQFPLAKGLGMGIGIEPVSYVGYQYADTKNLSELDGTADESFSGSGGLNKVYGTLSYKLGNRVSVGAKLGYLFGDVHHNRSVSFSTSNSYVISGNDTLRASGLVYEFGAQYHYLLAKNKEIVIGAVYTPKIPLGVNIMKGRSRYSSSQIVSSQDTTYTHLKFQLPETYAVGISYHKFNKLTVGADFQYQRWADAQYYSKTDSLSNRIKVNAGLEYIPNVLGHKFFSKMRYRVGAYYANSYFKATNSDLNATAGYKEYGATLGFGIPMIDRRSFINMAFEYALIRPESTALINEQYFKFTLSYTFNELWFFKRKLQ